ncbi:3-deoxy-D-arabino-heptulosonate 7-phosphate synthase [Paraburkholderia sp. CNPSo 3274]|uniref:3-deoxy-D-arabino-heptulosonate 7-phosphate synthase n=1 Tax=Paraburkholderia sp. CNPSo 3274 TaxID=2940932 RepID=UPI0020B7B9E4|nr:3-deoxy-D-arabino-heptulosonate 7-phosphate synthase [Paraburkholderia sp. CNPSo 3274]MCP3712980.1 3-deoxy-D-arabino-heptulosonate 7-phosphate synthase [Paraburkholderia sp. CNPSo 3274]
MSISALLLEKILRDVPRRYRLPQEPAASALPLRHANAPTALARVIEQAREARAHGGAPDATLKPCFIDALAAMITEAMYADSGDRAFQAMVLRHRAAQVREFASLSAQADQDRRQIHAAVNAIAHPAKQQRALEAWQREALARLHSSASLAHNEAHYAGLHETARHLLVLPELAKGSDFEPALADLRDSPALARLCRLESLASDPLVQQYVSMLDAYGPRPGTPAAVAQGRASQRRGAAVEALAVEALEALAQRLNVAQENPHAYRVVSSMRVPASIPGKHERAKTEWDVVLLERLHAKTLDIAPVWNVRLLVEAKASVESATTDLPRLMRGLRLLAHAEENVVYSFETQQGPVRLHGASLRAQGIDESGLLKAVLYCCDAPAEGAPRMLNAASRMQLLSAPASLEYASAQWDGRHADPEILEAVWQQLTQSPRWHAVLDQYSMLRLVRELMVHPEDLTVTIRDATGCPPGPPQYTANERPC